jgi:hypothetical protein
MLTVKLIQKLRDIRRAIGVEDATAVLKMVIEAEECALQLQQETPEQIRRTSRFESACLGTI